MPDGDSQNLAETIDPQPSGTPTMPPGVGISDLAVSGPAGEIEASPIAVSLGRNRYLIKKFHARGGMGEIWVSEDSHLGREVAVKMLSLGGQDAKKRFLAEAQVTGQLEHPGIVPVHDMGLDEAGRPFYVMKFVRGRSLKQAIDEYHATGSNQGDRELQWHRLLQVFVDICHAVAYAHSRGVLHRDLKPDNVMLGPYGETMVLDWGLARVRGQPEAINSPPGISGSSSGTAETTAGSIMGSPLYMAPEMAHGKMLDVDERTDVYLLGATLYQILTGQPPRDGQSRDEILNLARTSQPVPPRGRKPDIPKAIEAICLKASAEDKDNRYASALNLAQDVQRYLAGEPVLAFPENAFARTWRWCRRHRRALGRTAVTLLILAAAGFVLVRFRQMQQRQRESLQEAAELREQELTRAQIEKFDGLVDEARFYAASTDPITEHAPYYDPDKGRVAAGDALAATSDWGFGLQRLPLQQQSGRLRSEMYELLLLLVQGEMQAPQGSTQDAAALLDRAARLISTPTRSYYRLRRTEFELQKNMSRVGEMLQRENDPLTPLTAFDYFLLGEELRRRSATARQPSTANQALSPDQIGDLNQAIDAYRKALQIDPKDYWSHFQLGRCYLSIGNCPEAVEALGACIALRPDAPWGYSARGMALGLMHRFDEAIDDLNHAIAIDPDFRPARLNRGVVYSLQENRAAALADFAAALQPPEKRMLIEAAYYRAQIYLESNDYVGALSDLDSVIRQKRDFYPSQGNQASGLQDLSDMMKYAMDSSFDPASAEGLGQRGRMLRHVAAQLPNEADHATLKLASEDLEKAVELGGPSAQIYADLGSVLENLGQIDDAIAAYSSAIQLDPLDAQIRIDRGWAYQKLGSFERSRADFDVAVRSDLTNAEAHAGLGYVEACQKSYDEATEEAARAMLYGVNDYLILHDVACIYAEMSRTDVARESEDQDVAVAILGQAREQWLSGKSGPDEIQLIEKEPAFPPSLRARSDFQKLLVRIPLAEKIHHP
jgi:tetratricopeptide (TPR) repeat protein